MNSSAFVTVCPDCGTRFRVQPAQLQVASGKVRCGACLHVFVARDHAAPDTARVAPGDDAAGAQAHAEEAGAENGGDAAREAAQADAPADAVAPAIGDAGSDASAGGAEAAGTAATDAGATDAASPERAASPAAIAPAPRFTVLEPHGDVPDVDPNPATRRRAVLEGELEPGLTWEQRAQFDALKPMLDDRVQASAAQPPSPRARRVLIVAVALAVIVGQALYFKAEEWSSIASVRPVYTGLCWALGCTVPTYRDPAALRSDNVVVRPHPERGDVLLVDAQISNTAPYPQAFPGLRVDLLDRNGQIISSRVFEPQDYRTGELATMPEVPSNRPLLVSVEVYRPRADVVNFRFELLPAGTGR